MERSFIDDIVPMPSYPAPMDTPEKDVRVIRESFLKDMIERIAHRSYDLTLRRLDKSEQYVIELVVRGLNHKLHTVNTLAHCYGSNAGSNANKYLSVVQNKIKKIEQELI